MTRVYFFNIDKVLHTIGRVHMSRREFCKAAHIRQSTFQSYVEHGTQPSSDMLCRMADALGIHAEELMTKEV